MILNSRVARQREITGEPLNSRSRILAPNKREITGVDCISKKIVKLIHFHFHFCTHSFNIFSLFEHFLKYPCIKIEGLESRLKLIRVSQHSMKIRQIIAKKRMLCLSQNHGFMLISSFRASTVPNLKALA